MPLVKNGAVIEDTYTRIEDDAELPSGGNVMLSAKRLLTDPDTIFDKFARVGVIWPNNQDVAELAPFLDRLAMVALIFPIFRDGRAYSQARLLRERFGFRGELRATGQVLRDQFVFMQRAGFDAFDAKKKADAEAFAKTVARYTVFYQPTGDGRVTALNQRIQQHRAGSAERRP